MKRFVKECLTEMRDEKLKTLGGKLEKAQGEFWGDTVPKYVVRKVVGRELGRWDDIVRVSGEGR